MALWIIIGNVGYGKTMLLTSLGHLMYDDAYTLYCNYNLYNIPYYELDMVDDLLSIETEYNFIMGDEWYNNANARRAMSIKNLEAVKNMKQHRKRKHIVCLSMHDFDDIDVDIRNITDNILEPRIVKSDASGKPLILDVKVCDWQSDDKTISNFLMPLVIQTKHGLIDVPNSYDTYQVVDELGDDRYEKEMRSMVSEVMKKYRGFEGGVRELSAILEFDEEIDSELCGKLANYVKAKQT